MDNHKDEFLNIISRLPLKSVVQCKLVSKNAKLLISDPEFAKTLFDLHRDSVQLIYTIFSGAEFKLFPKISFDPIIQSVSTLPDEIEILASCNGLILIEFERVMRYCVFNPFTGEHQLIPYPTPTLNDIEITGLAVDYPNLDQYKLIAISERVENSNLFYKFYLISSQQPDVWREILMRTNNFLNLPAGSLPVYWRNTMYWLRMDASVVAFDTNREEGILIDRPEFLDHYEDKSGKITKGRDVWLGMAQDVLTLVCIFRRHIVIAPYDNASRRWNVTRILNNFASGPGGSFNGFPVWIDSKQVSFLVPHDPEQNNYYDLYQCNTNTLVYEITAVLRRVNYPMYCFHPTLASVHWRPANDVDADDQAHIAANLNDIRRFIIEGLPAVREEEEEDDDDDDEEEEEVGGEEDDDDDDEEEEEAGGDDDDEEEEAGGGGGA